MDYKLLVDITDYIILFPIKWYNLIKRVIHKATAYYNVMIISKNSLVNNLSAFTEITKILKTHNIITKQVEFKDLVIIYFKNQECIRFFDYWLNMIVLRCGVDLFKEVKCSNILSDNFYIEINDLKIYVGKANENNLFVSTTKTGCINEILYNYNYFTFKKMLLDILQSTKKNV